MKTILKQFFCTEMSAEYFYVMWHNSGYFVVALKSTIGHFIYILYRDILSTSTYTPLKHTLLGRVLQHHGLHFMREGCVIAVFEGVH